jgi:UDP-3-O-[3-hydroxymyristoyl] glucosamine N-acyltransferase
VLRSHFLLKLRDIAERLDCRLEGGADDIETVRVAGIEHAQAGDLTFVANPRYQSLLQTTQASAVILADNHHIQAPCPILRCDNPYRAFAHALGLLMGEPAGPPKGIDPASRIAADAMIGADVSIGPFVVIGSGASVGDRTIIHPHVVIAAGTQVGDDCILHTHVSIRERIRIGRRVIIHDGAVIGSDGFGFAREADGTHLKIPQRADVVIEDDVEIGANTTIDRPAVGETRICAGAKIDNLVQIGHGVSVGRHALLAAQVGIAGSTVVEEGVTLAGQVGVSGHLRIGKGAVATAQTGIPNSVDPGGFVSGYPAIPNREWLKASAIFRQLPTLKKRIAQLESRIAELEEKLIECRTRLDR